MQKALTENKLTQANMEGIVLLIFIMKVFVPVRRDILGLQCSGIPQMTSAYIELFN